MPESGENILAPRNFSATSLALAGATRLTAVDSLIADALNFDAAAEGVVVPFRLTDDVDIDPSTARLRLQFQAAILSGTSVSMNIANITGIYTSGTTYANSIAAVAVTAATQVITAIVPTRFEFDLDADFRNALAASAAPAGTGLKSLYLELNAPAVAGSGVLHVFDVTLMYGSMIVPALTADRD